MMTFFRRWTIHKAEKKLRLMPNVYDVRTEEPVKDRYLIHVFMTELNPEVERQFSDAVGRMLRRRPGRVKINVLLYKMAG